MGVKASVAGLFVLVCLLAPPAQAADSIWAKASTDAHKALLRSVKAGFLTKADAARYTAVVRRAQDVSEHVPPGRADLIEAVLVQIAQRKSPTAERAHNLYATLETNADYFEQNPIPDDGTDVADADGLVYRFFSGKGLYFHPLANASKLNGLFTSGRTDEAAAMATVLAARAIPAPRGAAVWEYQFDYGNVRAPWASGMAQAVLAQALARAGDLALARRAYRAIPGALDRDLPAGPWLELYGGSGVVVLNAQLQGAISIADYAELANDADAAAYADRLLATAKTMLPQFDTGRWSRYSLGLEANLHYQNFVIGLLKTLAKRTGDTAWSDAAARFQLYETQPSAVTGPTATRLVYPRPEDGVRDTLTVRYFLSKISQTALVVDGKAVDGGLARGGWNAFRWTPRSLGFGTHTVRVVATARAGGSGSADAGTFEVARDTEPPALAAAKSGGKVFWRAKDGESACCHVRLELGRGSQHKVLPQAKRDGSARVPAGYWHVVVVARDEAGNRAEKDVGLVIGTAATR
jgi:hypothetical protein